MKDGKTIDSTMQHSALVEKLKAGNKLFIMEEADEASDEYAHFYFLGEHDGKEVLFDTVLYTLRFQHESELFEIAEQKAAEHFPNYKRIEYEEDENGNLQTLDDQEEEIGLFMAEVILELEEEEQVKVKEHVDLDLHHNLGIGLDVGLHVERVTPALIESFIRDFNADTLTLDPALYSFQTQSDDLQV